MRELFDLSDVCGGISVRNLEVTLPPAPMNHTGSLMTEQAADLQAAQLLRADPSLGMVSYQGRSEDGRFAIGSYSRNDYNRDLANGDVFVRNGDVYAGGPNTVNDRFSGLENPPSFATGNGQGFGNAFDERFGSPTGNGGGLPSWANTEQPTSYTSSGFPAWREPGTRSVEPSSTYDGGASSESSYTGSTGSAYTGSGYTGSGTTSGTTSEESYGGGSSSSYTSSPTQTFDDGSTLTTYDDGSTLAQGTDGSHSSSPSYDDYSSTASYDSSSYDSSSGADYSSSAE